MATENVNILINAKNNASRELKTVSSDLQKMSQTASRLMSQGGIAAAVGVGVAAAIAKTGGELARLASSFDALYGSFENLASGAGQSADAMLNAMRNASQGMVSDMELVQSANRALLLGVADSAEEMDKLLQVAIVRGQAMGLSTAQAFNDLVTGIGRMSPLILDNLGIVTGGEKVFNDYAEAIGKSADELTDAEKKQALLNKVVAESAEMIATATESSTRGYEQLAASIDNAKKALGAMFNDDVNARAGDLADIIIRLIDRLEKYDNTVKKELALFPVEFEMDDVAEQIAMLEDMQSQLRRDVAQGANAADYSGSLKALTGVNAELELLYRRQRELIDDAAELSAAYDPVIQQWGAMSDISNPVIQTFEDIESAVNGVGDAIKDVAEIDLDDLTADFADLMETLKYQREQLGGQATASEYEYFGAAAGAAQGYEDALGNLERQSDATREATAGTSETAEILGRVLADLPRDIDLAIASLADFSDELAIAGASMAGLIAMREQFGSAATASEYEYFGPGMDPATGTYEDRIAALQRETKAKQDAWREEYAATQSQRELSLRSAKEINKEYEKVKGTIEGIVSGAIGPVAGVDANALLPREDAVNENARRLADIAVNGFKGQEWLDEFAMEAPDVFEQLKNSSDPKATAAQILKDFQDGLVPELLDKDRAKELVKRALQGDANTKQLVDEIAGELASELGISLGEAKATASEVLGGGEGATGVSLAPKIDATAAESAASAFASSFNAAISGSTIGADLSGTIMTQVMASVAAIEASGNEAGKALVKGVTATFTDIPAAFIAAVAALVTPAVQASINQNGGRTGAAAV